MWYTCRRKKWMLWWFECALMQDTFVFGCRRLALPNFNFMLLWIQENRWCVCRYTICQEIWYSMHFQSQIRSCCIRFHSSIEYFVIGCCRLALPNFNFISNLLPTNWSDKMSENTIRRLARHLVSKTGALDEQNIKLKIFMIKWTGFEF